MKVGTREEAECLTFRQHMGGDTLDAFAPLSHYTTRVHDGQMESTWTKVSKSITYPDGTVDWGLKETQPSGLKDKDTRPHTLTGVSAHVL